MVSDDNCIPRIAYILKKTGFMLSISTEKCSFYYHTTYLTFIDRQFAALTAQITNKLIFAHDWNELLVTGVTDCEAALILIKAMEHNNVRKLVLHLDNHRVDTKTH